MSTSVCLEIDEPVMMERVVTRLQSVIALPLQIDTSDTIAMERGMRLYNGKPMINSVSGKMENMEAVFPLVRKVRRCCCWSGTG